MYGDYSKIVEEANKPEETKEQIDEARAKNPFKGKYAGRYKVNKDNWTGESMVVKVNKNDTFVIDMGEVEGIKIKYKGKMKWKKIGPDAENDWMAIAELTGDEAGVDYKGYYLEAMLGGKIPATWEFGDYTKRSGPNPFVAVAQLAANTL